MSTHSAVVEQVTPKQAAAWLDHNYEHNRPLSSRHVRFLSREMELDRFTLATIHFMYVDGAVHLVNGQHTLHAIVDSGKSQTCVVIRQHDCAADDLPKVFMHYDQQRKRSFADTAVAFQIPKKMGVHKHWVGRVAAAIKHGKSGFASPKSERTRSYISVADLFDWVPSWENELHLIVDSIAFGKAEVTSRIHTASVFSVALITAYYKPEDAARFWNMVAHNDGLANGHPCKTLHEYLPKTKANKFGETVPGAEVSRAVAHCWNAYMEGRPYTRVSVRSDSLGLPLKLSGTPYSGNQSLTFWPTRNQERAAA